MTGSRALAARGSKAINGLNVFLSDLKIHLLVSMRLISGSKSFICLIHDLIQHKQKKMVDSNLSKKGWNRVLYLLLTYNLPENCANMLSKSLLRAIHEDVEQVQKD